MARKYKIGDRYYLPVVVSDVVNTFIRMTYLDGVNNNPLMINDRPDLLLTAEEIAGTLKTKADAMTVTADSLQEENEELKDKCAEFLKTIGKQSDKLRELQARIVELNEVNSSLGENRDALNNEAAVHMTSIHNLQVAVEVLAEKIFEMRCEQDGEEI